jgi:ATP-binding cassette subfamily C (CFTR/MRP) protein 1
MQNCIRNIFKDCTVLTIAHRTETIIDYDRVIVIDGGKIVKSGPPKEVLNNVEI